MSGRRGSIQGKGRDCSGLTFGPRSLALAPLPALPPALLLNGTTTTRTGKRRGHPDLNPNPGLSLTLDLLCERLGDTWWNLGHGLN